MERYKEITEFILKKELPYDRLDEIFYELYLINPNSPMKEIILYPKNFFHSKYVYQSMVTSFENILKSDKKLILRKRFRAFLALIYLKGMKKKGFYGYKKLLQIEDNQETFNLACKVFHSEDFKSAFLEFDSILAEKDSYNI